MRGFSVEVLRASSSDALRMTSFGLILETSGSGFGEFVEGAAQEVEEMVEQVERDRE
jgi:hypothetical protein